MTGNSPSTMTEYAETGSASVGLAAFLAAATRAHKTIVIAGGPGAGKSALLRALLDELAPAEPLAVISPVREPLVRADRPGTTLLLDPDTAVPAASPARTSLTVEDLIAVAARRGVEVIVVGEVRGHEVIAMLASMAGGHASMTTVHAKNGRDAVERLVTCATKHAEVSTTWAYREVAQLVDLIVHVDVVDDASTGGGRRHYISEVVMPHLSGDADYSVAPIYQTGPDGRAIPAAGAKATIAPWLDELRRHGFDTDHLNPGSL